MTSQYDGSGATKRLCVDWVSAESALLITDAQGIGYMEELDIITD